MSIGVVIVGCGTQAYENLMPSIMQLQELSVIGLCDTDASALSRAASLFPQAQLFDDAASIFESSIQPDCLLLAGPPQMHYLTAKQALLSGMHVFVEKPPTVTTLELRELADIADRMGLVTTVDHNLRYSGPLTKVTDILRSENIGTPVAVDLRYVSAGPKNTLWGMQSPLRSFLLAHGIHVLDLLVNLIGDIQIASASEVILEDEGRYLTIQARSESTVASVIVATTGTFFDFDLRLLTSKSAVIHLDSMHRVDLYCPSIHKSREGSSWRSRTLERGYEHAGYQGAIHQFTEAIKTGSTASPSLRDEIRVYKLIDEVERVITSLHANDLTSPQAD